MSNEENGETTVGKTQKHNSRYAKFYVPQRNKTEYPDTPMDVEECEQAIYAMQLWILQHDMGLTFEDAQILLSNKRWYELTRILENHGYEEGSPGYDEKYDLALYYYDTLREKYEAELEKRSKRFKFCGFRLMLD